MQYNHTLGEETGQAQFRVMVSKMWRGFLGVCARGLQQECTADALRD